MRSGLLLQGHAAPTSLVLSPVESINVAVVVWWCICGVQRGLCSSPTPKDSGKLIVVQGSYQTAV